MFEYMYLVLLSSTYVRITVYTFRVIYNDSGTSLTVWQGRG